MERYIDADKLIAHLKDEIEGCKPPFCGRANGKSIAYGTILGLKSAISFAETLSTADVVPKSEYERLQEEAEKQSILWRQHFESIYETGKETFRAEVAREIFEEIDELLSSYSSTYKMIDIEEYEAFKKKYTEGEPNG